MKRSDLTRYGIWLSVAATADANRREYNMLTTWLPHLLTNTLSLLLPDLLRGILREKSNVNSANEHNESNVFGSVRAALSDVVATNPRYVIYVTPLAAGYLLSHPRFNIYKGELAEKRIAGLGLDALPHAATAFALTALVCDSVHAAEQHAAPENPLRPLLSWSDQHPGITSLLVLVTATLFWEIGEYRVHVYELAQRGGDPEKINMQWSVRDTLNDILANFIGWLLALVLRRTRG